jgi:hypothetical protein
MDSRATLRFATVLLILAGGGAAADDREVQLRIRDETIPAGGVVQLKAERYEVTPISGGRPGFNFDASFFDGVAGLAMFAPSGELAGAAVIDDDRVNISFVTTKTAPGDLPLLSVSLRVRKDAGRGNSTRFTLDPSSTWSQNGTILRTRIEPATVTVGGSLSVASVVPGQGVFPAGTVVSVRGMGFNRETRLRVEDVEIRSVRFVSSTELQFTLAERTNMTGKRLRIDNRDGSRVFYYSYTNGSPAAISTRPLLSATVPLFSGVTRSTATFAMPAMVPGQYAGLALLNPNLAAVKVTVTAYSSDGATFYSSSLALQQGQHLALEVSEVLDGVTPPQGGVIRVTSSLPVHVSRLLCDDRTWSVTPALPASP